MEKVCPSYDKRAKKVRKVTKKLDLKAFSVEAQKLLFSYRKAGTVASAA